MRIVCGTIGKWGQSPQGPWRRVLEETSCQLNCCQIKKERRCRGLSGIVRFGKSMKAVVLVERDNGVVGINRDEPTSCFIEVAVATVDACKNGGIDNQLKRKAAERESVSRRFHRVRLLHGSTCWLESDVWSANRRQSRRASSFRREGQYRRVAQSVLRLYPSTLELT